MTRRTPRFLPWLHLALATPLVPAAVGAQVGYDVSFPNAAHHEAAVVLTLTDVPPEPVRLLMSRSSPGRYALHEFAKNVYDVRAEDGTGRPLAVARVAPSEWEIADHDGSVRVRYTLYGDMGDGTYAQIDASHAHLNMPATFLWAGGHEEDTIRVRFHPPAGSGWKAATQLVPTDDPLTFTAPGLQYFMDSPTELSDFTERRWTVRSATGVDTIRMVVHHQGSEEDVDRFADAARKIVDQEDAVFGGPPPFDHGTYTFIADYLPWMSGDGMEHRNSTVLTSRRTLRESAVDLLGTASHEFFHAWNVERIRPRSLEPFDFERANMSGALWFAEGFTSYYGPLLLARAGLIDLGQYAAEVAGAVSTVTNAPGRRFASPVGMSMQAPFVDAATSVDPTNERNTFISYYTWGSALGLALDLTLRSRFDCTLDGYMREAWHRFGEPEVSYTVPDLEALLAEYTGDPGFAGEFFRRYVYGNDLPDFGTLLARAGLLLRPMAPGAAFLGSDPLSYDARGATLTAATEIGSPLYEAGLDRGDVILQLDGRALRSDDDWRQVLARHRPGDAIELVYLQRGRMHTVTVAAAVDPRLEIVPFEEAGRPLTDAMRSYRAAWLGAR